MRTYTITVTERQAAELQEACELLARIKIGQIDHAIERLPGYHDHRDWDRVHGTRHEIQRLANSLMPEVTKRREDGVAWDLYQVIRHRLAWDRAHDLGVIKPGESRKWPEMMGVSYDEPLKMGEEPLAKIREKTDDPTLRQNPLRPLSGVYAVGQRGRSRKLLGRAGRDGGARL